MKTTAIAVTLFCALPLAHAGASFLITNGDFETGTLAGWTATTGAPYMDVTGSCNDGFAAQSSAVGCTPGTNPAFGTYAAYSSTSFPAISNNVGEWDNFLSQNIVVPVGPINNATLTLDYTATWGSAGSFFHGVNVEAEILHPTHPIFYGYSEMSGQRLKHLQLIISKSIDVLMIYQENANDFTAGLQRNTYFRQRRRFASDVIRVLAHIGRVAHLACACRVADHAVLAQLQAVAFAANFAASTAVRAGQN